MEVLIVSTKTCPHSMILRRELSLQRISFRTKFAEEDLDFCEQHNIFSSPIIILNGKIIHRGMPPLYELPQILGII